MFNFVFIFVLEEMWTLNWVVIKLLFIECIYALPGL